MATEDSAPAAPDADSDPGSKNLVGRTVGEFRVVRPLGAGGMAEVFLAEQVSLKRPVALKVLRADAVAGADQSLIDRFAQEATAAANLSHPNIVQVYAIGRDEGLHYIAQEYVEGTTAGALVKTKGPLALPAALKLLRQVASALRAAGVEGIVHRDIKPENILVSRKGVAKVADFGLARLEAAEGRQALTRSGMTMGTPLYMSPEQVGGKAVDGRTDLYSLGVTMFHLLAGQPPFRGETAVAIAVKHLNETPPTLKSLRPDLPPALSELLGRLLEKRPADRYADAEELLRDVQFLSKAVKERPDALAAIRLPRRSEPQSVIDDAGPTPIWERPWRSQAAALVAPVLAAVVAGVGFGFAVRPADPFAEPAAPSVRRDATAADQYWRAIENSADRAGWEALVEYFPDDAVYVREAEYRLALLALVAHEHDRAARLLTSVERESSGEPGLQDAVLIARATIAAREGEGTRAIAMVGRAVQGEEIRDDAVPFVRELLRREDIPFQGETLARLRAWAGEDA